MLKYKHNNNWLNTSAQDIDALSLTINNYNKNGIVSKGLNFSNCSWATNSQGIPQWIPNLQAGDFEFIEYPEELIPGTHLYKYGQLVCWIWHNLNNNEAWTTMFQHIATIPEGYRPIVTICLPRARWTPYNHRLDIYYDSGNVLYCGNTPSGSLNLSQPIPAHSDPNGQDPSTFLWLTAE